MAKTINLQVKLTTNSKKRFENKMKNLMKFIQPNRALSKLFGNLAMDINANAGIKAPVDQGALRQSAYMKGTDFNLEVGFNAEYARAVEFGSKKHTIKVKNKKVLFNDRTKTFFGKEVKHPGNKPQPFFFPVVNKEVREFTKKWQDKLRKIISKK